MIRIRLHSRSDQNTRRGSLLLVVLVVIAALGFSVYAFSEQALLGYEATQATAHQLQLQRVADSGIEAVRGALEQGRPVPASGGVGDLNGQNTTFLIVHPAGSDGSGWSVGMDDESSRLNLNALPLQPSRRKQSEERLLHLTGMTPDLAATLMEWMATVNPSEALELDLDDLSNPPRRRFQRLDELLLVPGITSEKLYGEDTNGNGMRDPDEPDTNRDGLFSCGLSAEISLVARESNLQLVGNPKINVNQKSLASLYDQLLPVLGREGTLFIVAARISPLEYRDLSGRAAKLDPEEERLKRLDSAKQRLINQLVDREQLDAEAGKTEQRDGLILPAIAMGKLDSLFKLAGGTVQVTIDGEDQVLQSPWPATADGFATILHTLEPVLTTVDGPWLEGRICLRSASLPVLRTVPGISEQVALAIRAQQKRLDQKESLLIWLAREGLLTPSEFREASAWLTERGDVSRGISIGTSPAIQSVAGIFFTVARHGNRTVLLEYRDLPYRPKTPFSSFLPQQEKQHR